MCRAGAGAGGAPGAEESGGQEWGRGVATSACASLPPSGSAFLRVGFFLCRLGKREGKRTSGAVYRGVPLASVMLAPLTDRPKSAS